MVDYHCYDLVDYHVGYFVTLWRIIFLQGLVCWLWWIMCTMVVILLYCDGKVAQHY